MDENKPKTSYYTRDELSQVGFKSFGENVLISRKTSIYGAENMIIGSNVRIDDFCFLSGKIELRNYIVITAACMLYGGEHGILFDDFSSLGPRGVILANSDDYSGNSLTNPMVPEKFEELIDLPVHVGRHVIIGTGTTVLPGVTLGDGCSIGAMSLVTKSTEPWTINVGIPSRSVKPRSKKLLQYEKKFLEELENKI